MTPRYCEVALPVPLRSTFTYAVPDSFQNEDLVGRRVLVPFRNRAMVGVGLSVSERPPAIARVKEISELLDPIAALPPKATESAATISRPSAKRFARCFLRKSSCAMIANTG
jgi:primosomal protein N' (replication factor Y) (superfamily II helicase)